MAQFVPFNLIPSILINQKIFCLPIFLILDYWISSNNIDCQAQCVSLPLRGKSLRTGQCVAKYLIVAYSLSSIYKKSMKWYWQQKRIIMLDNTQLIDGYYLPLNFVSNYWYVPYQAYIAISVKCPSITWAKQFQLSNAPLYLCRPLFQQTPAISSIRSTRSLNQVLKPSTRIARKWSTNQLHVWCEIIDLCAISW